MEEVYEGYREDGLWVFKSYSEPARDQIVRVKYADDTQTDGKVVRTMYYRNNQFTVAFRPL